MIQGFIDVFREEFDKVDFPVAVNTIRLATNPRQAVAAGCLRVALEETRSLHEESPDVSPAALERAAISGIPKMDEATPRLLARLQTASFQIDGHAPTNGSAR